MRSFICSILLFASTTAAQAAISKDELQARVYDGDIAGVEAAFAEAHQQSLSGEITYDELRLLMHVLTRTHPDTVDFRERWLKDMPQSAYALAAMGWAIQNDSIDIRGNASSRQTPKDALRAASYMKGEAHTLMQEAYRLAPDFVPASDGIIIMSGETKRLWGWQLDAIIQHVMNTTPNYGTLLRASFLSSRAWGGAGPEFNAGLCNRYADKIPEYPDMNKDICTVSLMAYQHQADENWNYVADVLDREDHEVLAYARALRARERGTEQDYQIVKDYVLNASFETPWFYYEMDMVAAARTQRYFLRVYNTPAFSEELAIRIHSEIKAQLVHDPFRVSLLTVLTGQDRRFPEIVRLGVPGLIENEALLRNYTLRLAVAQPFHLSNWSNAGRTGRQSPAFLSKPESEIGFSNAIAYSDHNLSRITEYLGETLRDYNKFKNRDQRTTYQGELWPSEAEFMNTIGCRTARLIRLFDDAAKRAPEKRNEIDGFRISENLAAVTAELQDEEACRPIWEAQVDDLRFEPIVPDRRSLLKIDYDPSPHWLPNPYLYP